MSNTPVDERQALLTKNDGGTPIVQEYGTASSSGTSTPSIVKPSAINSPSGTDLLWILGGLWSAVFLGALDTTIVATLVSPIGSYFQKSHQASYLGTSYLLSVCCFTPLYGIGTLLCGIATSMEFLIFARAVAGMGGGGVMTGRISVTDIIPLKQRGLYQGLANILFGLGSGIGGPVGGWINDTFGWRTAFLIQIPILVLSAIVITFKVNIKLPETKQTARQKLARIDYAGSFTLVVCVGSLLLGLSLKTGEDLKWSSPIVVSLLCLSAVFAVVFVLVEAKWAPEPVMPMRLLTMRTPFFVAVSNFCMSCYAFSMLYNVPLYFSAVRLNSASESGLHLLPNAVGLVLIAVSCGSVFAGWQDDAKNRKTVLVDDCFSSWSFVISRLDLFLERVYAPFAPLARYCIWRVRHEFPHHFNSYALIASVDKKDYAVATGISYLFRTTGQVLGVSLSGALVQAVLVSSLRKGIQGPDAEKIIQSIRHSTAIIPTLDPPLRVVAIQSYQRALTTVFTCQVVLAFVLMLSCLPIEENPLPGSHEEQEQQERLRRERNGRVAA
ncbi:major facilitator superfamily transporter [Rhizoctonia solani]|uniref:Major facilitator superfamily transporter n=1 Tax=Rhizoctonia solani TaxID=456999 RepID=A0A8H8NVQ7_9AGAM|nr:major facilitator superfamily transporter [Rhizoctonia solani]QRW19223.1 major facilitator superfamily transporter [Rhizoctonia solani]